MGTRVRSLWRGGGPRGKKKTSVNWFCSLPKQSVLLLPVGQNFSFMSPLGESIFLMVKIGTDYYFFK